MGYELAKQLKDAGLHQAGNGSWIGPPDKLVWRGSDRIYVPTLEELLEACGDMFGGLDRQSAPEPLWTAFSSKRDHRVIGSTPAEAVARLWLALYA